MIEDNYQRFYSMTGDPTAAALLTLAEAIGAEKPDMLTVGDAAKALGLSLSKTYELVREGRLRHNRIGRAIRISPADLATFQRDATKAPAKGLRYLG